MKRNTEWFYINNSPEFKQKLKAWAAQQKPVCLLDSNNGVRDRYSTWDLLIGAGSHAEYTAAPNNHFDAAQKLIGNAGDWAFGYFGYDLKNEVESLHSANFDGCGLPEMYFFCPKTVVGIRGDRAMISTFEKSPQSILDAVLSANTAQQEALDRPIALAPRIEKAQYLQTIDKIKAHIIEGDLYEVNFCQEFFAAADILNPFSLFEKLNQLSEAPFATYLFFDTFHVLCSSPERFLKKTADLLVTQPIKGTRRRDSNPELDQILATELKASEKDRAENVMIVDLARNDLARQCAPGSVVVPELFGIYSFKTVHQMISTVTGTLLPQSTGIEALRAAFPPGSMTGAPKVMAMQLIEAYEQSRRGIYSGALGYITPEGDFDFNVVIRTLVYNAAKSYVSAHVGGAIVFDSDPENEYQECLVKAQALFKALASGPFPAKPQTPPGSLA